MVSNHDSTLITGVIWAVKLNLGIQFLPLENRMIISTFQGDERDSLLCSFEKKAVSAFMFPIAITHFLSDCYPISPHFYQILQSHVSWFSLTSLTNNLASTLKEELRSQLH